LSKTCSKLIYFVALSFLGVDTGVAGSFPDLYCNLIPQNTPKENLKVLGATIYALFIRFFVILVNFGLQDVK